MKGTERTRNNAAMLPEGEIIDHFDHFDQSGRCQDVTHIKDCVPLSEVIVREEHTVSERETVGG